VSGQLHAPAALPLWKSPRYPFYRRLGGPLSRSRRRGEEKILDPNGTRTPDLSFAQPVASRYTDYAIPVTFIYLGLLINDITHGFGHLVMFRQTLFLPPPPPYFWGCTSFVFQNCWEWEGGHCSRVLISHADSKVSVQCTSKYTLPVPWYWSRNSSVGIEPRVLAGRSGNRDSIPNRGNIFSFSPQRPNRF
jgi:hypothetical protein